MSQLPLPFVHEPKLGAEDFMPSESNAAALAAVAGWPAWADPVLLLIGPEGSGKSHLARIWALRVGATLLDRNDFERDLHEVASRPAVLEDADRAGFPEAKLFHLLNLVREAGSWLVITARQSPDAWGLETPDLVSRLRLASTAELGFPDEALMRAVLVKLFADRQLAVEANIIDYLALHLERSLAAVQRTVEDLDRAGLGKGRRISRALAAGLFAELQLDEE